MAELHIPSIDGWLFGAFTTRVRLADGMELNWLEEYIRGLETNDDSYNEFIEHTLRFIRSQQRYDPTLPNGVGP